MDKFMMMPKGFVGLPMEEEFITAAENKKNTQVVIDDRGYCDKFDFICHDLRLCQAWEERESEMD